MQMLNILFLIESLGGGGAEKILADLVNHLDHNRFSVTLLTVTDGGVWEQAVHAPVRLQSLLRSDDAHTLRYKLKYHLLRKLPARLAYRLFVHRTFDVEIAFCEGFATRLIAASPNRNSKKLAWVHIDPIRDPHGDRAFKNIAQERQSYEKFDRILCVSHTVKTTFCKKFGITEQVGVQYNPVDVQAIAERAQQPTLLPPSSGLIFVCVARLQPAKGVDRLLQAAAKLRQEGFDFTLWVLGEGPMRSSLEAQIAELHLQNCVQLLGFRQNPYPFIQAADVYVSASYAEGFSTAATEALVLGTPVCSTDCAGMREVLGDEPCGMLTEDTQDGIYEGLHRLLASPEHLQAMRAAAQRRALQFSLHERIREIEGEFEA